MELTSRSCRSNGSRTCRASSCASIRLRAGSDARSLSPVSRFAARLCLCRPDGIRTGVPIDIEGHLFGRNRIPLTLARSALTEVDGPGCFYCETKVSVHVYYVLPWSRVGIDGLANLVLACAQCNSSKSQLLPAVEHTTRALGRDQAKLAQIATEIEWPYQYDRTVAAARGLYMSTPADTPTWLGIRRFTRLDLTFPPFWYRLSEAVSASAGATALNCADHYWCVARAMVRGRPQWSRSSMPLHGNAGAAANVSASAGGRSPARGHRAATARSRRRFRRRPGTGSSRTAAAR